MQDLNGLQLDDTYYMFTLSNIFPYAYSPIYNSENGGAWTDPIQFLANGSLPTNLYWDDTLVYRLEIRKGNTQSDPLIYLIENYVPITGSGGPTPIPPGNNSTENVLTNPQFAEVSFQTTTLVSTLNVTNFAPGWQIVTTGTGSLTISQQTLAGTAAGFTSNASYYITIVNNGFTNVSLQQTFNDNGALWTNEYVAMTMAINTSAPSAVTSFLTYSGSVQQSPNIIQTTTNPSAWQTLNGSTGILASINTNVGDAAYTTLNINWSGNLTVNLTSIQLIGQDVVDNTVSYAQIPIERQIDHLYHLAYPIVPVGTIIDFAGFNAPSHYLLCNGSTVNRVQYLQLFNALTLSASITQLSTTTFSVSAPVAAQLGLGMLVEGVGISIGTAITVISGTTITVSPAVSFTGTINALFYAWGQGNGIDTFTVPNLNAQVLAGSGGNLFAITPLLDALGMQGGAATTTLLPANLPPHKHTVTASVYDAGSSGNFAKGNGTTGGNTATCTVGDGPGVPTAFTNIQPTSITYKYIRYE